MSRDLHLGLVCPEDIVPEVLRSRLLLKMQLCKPKLCCHAHFREKRFYPDIPSKQTKLVQSLSDCTVIEVNIEHTN